MRILTFVALIAVLAFAAITNPAPHEAEGMIKNETSKIVNEKVGEQLDKDTSGIGGFGKMILSALSPTVVDKTLDVEVKDYIFFTRFAAGAEIPGAGYKKLASGIIIFGKIIPLSTDLI